MPFQTRTASSVDWQTNLPGPFSSVPSELVLICGLMAIAGAFLLWPVIDLLHAGFGIIGEGTFGRDFGLLLVISGAILLFFSVSAFVLAWRMAHADRVARALSYVLLGGLGASILFGTGKDWQLVLVMLASIGAVVVLALAPRVRAFFTGPNAMQYDRPSSIVTVQALLYAWAGLIGLNGVIYLLLSDLASKFVVVGVFFLVLAAAACHLGRQLSAGAPLVRLLVTVGGLVYGVLLLVAGQGSIGLLVPLSGVVGAVAFLWLPQDARTFFAEGALRYPLPSWLANAGAAAGPQPTYQASSAAYLPPDVPPQPAPDPAPEPVSASVPQPVAALAGGGRQCVQTACGATGRATAAAFCVSCGTPTQSVEP
jgi:hypothetical protein